MEGSETRWQLVQKWPKKMYRKWVCVIVSRSLPGKRIKRYSGFSAILYETSSWELFVIPVSLFPLVAPSQPLECWICSQSGIHSPLHLSNNCQPLFSRAITLCLNFISPTKLSHFGILMAFIICISYEMVMFTNTERHHSVRPIDPGIKLSESESQLCNAVAVWPWSSHLAFLWLQFIHQFTRHNNSVFCYEY